LCADLAASYKISIKTQVQQNTNKQKPTINLKNTLKSNKHNSLK